MHAHLNRDATRRRERVRAHEDILCSVGGPRHSVQGSKASTASEFYQCTVACIGQGCRYCELRHCGASAAQYAPKTAICLRYQARGRSIAVLRPVDARMSSLDFERGDTTSGQSSIECAS
jgi:hypothetical protein